MSADKEKLIRIDDALNLLNRGADIANQKIAIRRLKELLTIKRNAEAILNDDTVNSWMTDKDATRRYTEKKVKKAADAFNKAQKETDEIIKNL